MGLKNWFRSWKNRRNQPIRNARTLARDKRERLLFERLEDRLAPAGALITSGPTGITIVVPNAETAVVTLAGSNYQITDGAGIDPGSAGGTIVLKTFTATNPASGQTLFTINDGTKTGTVQLFTGSVNVIPQTTTVVVNSGTFDLNGDNDAIDALNGAASAVVTNNSGGSTAILQVGSNGTSGEFDGVIQNGIALTLAGTGATEILTGANTYSGLTTIDSPSTLQIGNGIGSTGSLGLGNVNDAGFLTYDLVNTTVFVANNITGGGVLTVNSSTETVVLTGTGNTYSGGTNILSAATLQIGDTLSNGSIGNGQIDDEGNLVFQPQNSITVAATITTINNTGNVAQNGGAGTSVILTGGTSWNGTTTINAGTLQFGNSTFGSTTLLTSSILDNGTLTFKLNNGVTVPAAITGVGGLTQSGVGTVFLTNNGNLCTGGTNIQSGTVQAGSGVGGGSGSLGAGNVTGQAAGALIFDLNADYTFGYAITNIGSVTQEGTDTVTFDATPVNTYVLTNIAAGSTLQIGINGSHGSLGSGTVANTGMLIFDRSDQITVANNITGSGGSVTQEGDGTVTLTGTDTYTGLTTVSSPIVGHNSTLLVNAPGSITSNVSVPARGTLGGTGTITGSVTVSGGTLQPGTANPGILTTGTLALNSGTYSAVLGGSSAGNGAAFYNQDSVTGAASSVSINPNVTLNLTGFNSFVPQPGQQFTLINNAGTETGHFNNLIEGALYSTNFLGSGLSAYITYQGGPNGSSVVIIVAGPVTVPSGTSLIVKQHNGDLQVFNGANLLVSQPVGSVTSLNLSGVSGQSNSVTFDFTGGKAVIPGGITYTGGTLPGSSNSLNIVGGTFTNETVTPSSAHNGTITLDTQTINFTNLTPITDSATVTNFTVFGTGGADQINVINGPLLGGTTQSTEVNSGNGTFEKIDFANKTNVTINSLAGADTITMAIPNPEVGLNNLTVLGTGADAITLDGNVPVPTTLSLTAGGGVNQTAGAVTATNLQLTGTGTFSLFDAGNHVSGNLAASVNGPLSYTDSGALTVGTVTTAGIVTNNNNLILNAGGVSQTGGGIVNTGTGGLLLTGTGAFSLPDSNTIATVAAAVNGAVTLNDGTALTVGTVGATNGITTTGNSLTISATGTLALNQAINVGAATAVLSTGTAITDGNGANTEITAGDLALQAGSGIGTPAAPVVTKISNLAAATSSGGIYVNNTGALTIGFAGEPTPGVNNSGSGNIVLNNAGSVNITDPLAQGDNVQTTTGNITINASGAASNITTGGGNVTAAVNIAGSNSDTATLQAGGSLFLGSAGLTGSVVGGGGVALIATNGNISIDDGTQVQAFGAGTVTAQAGGNISLLHTTPGATITTQGGAVTLTTGAGKTFTATSGAAADVATAGGNITVNADSVSLVDSPSLNAGTGIVTIAPVTPGRIINLGPAAAGKLTLTDAELGNVISSVLRIGKPADTGNIQVTAAIGLVNSANYNSTLSLLTGGQITQGAADSITETNLQAQGGNGVALNSGTNAVGTVSGAATVAGKSFSFVDGASPLTVGTVDGLSGITTNAGLVGVQVFVLGGSLMVSSAISTGGGNITLIADTMSLGAAVDSGAGIVLLEPELFARPINLGGVPIVNDLNLLQADLNNVTAGVLRIGSLSDTAGLSFGGAITAPTGWNTLDLANGGGIFDNNPSPPTITVANLALQSQNGINNLNTVVSQLDFSNSGAGSVSISNTGGMTIAVVDGVTPVGNSAAGQSTSLSAASPITFAVNTTSAGDLSATAMETASESGGPEDDITVNSGITVSSTAGSVTFMAGDSINMLAGSTVSAFVAVSLTAGVGDTDTDASMTLNGNITAPTITINSPSNLVISTLSAGSSGTINLSANGSITEGLPDPAGVDITAMNLSLSATTGIGGSTGVGVGADPELETKVMSLVAFTSTGGIYLSNTGDLSIGGFLSEPFPGVTDLTSGDIVITSTGSVLVNSSGAGEGISGAGNVTVTAAHDVQATGGNGIFGAGNVMVTAGGNVVTGGGAITAIEGGGNVTVMATGTGPTEGNLFLGGSDDPTTGLPVASFGAGPVTSFGGNIQLTAATDIVIDGDTLVEVTSGTGSITANAGGNIEMQNPGFFGPLVATTGGAINLTTGPAVAGIGGMFTALSAGTDAVFSSGGGINISADVMSLQAGIDADGPGIVTLDTVTKTIGINLGTVVGGDLNLQQSDLNEVTASVLRIGNFATDTGGLTVSAAISAPSASPGTWNVLDLENAGSVTDNSGAGSLTVGSLALQGGAGVDFENTGNAVTTLAGKTTTGDFTFVNSTGLFIGTVDTVHGIQSGGAVTITLAATDLLTVNQPVSNGSGNDIAFNADAATINAAVNAGAGFVILERVTGTEAITVGTKPGGTLGLTQADLDNISTTKALIIGNLFADTGDLTVTAAITSIGTGWTTLALSTGGTVTQTGGSHLTVPSLNAFGSTGVTLTNAGNAVSNLTGGTDSASSFSFVDSVNLIVGGIPAVSPSDLETSGGSVSLTLAAGKVLTVNTTIDTTEGGTTPAGAAITLTADAMNLDAAVNGGTGGVVTLTTKSAAQVINLGTKAVGELGLLDSELGEVFGSVLVIGDTTNNTGGIVVSAAGIGTTNAGQYNNTLALLTKGSISETAGASLGTGPASPIGNLELEAGGNVNLPNLTNAATILAGSSTTGSFTFADAVSFTVGTVNAISGIFATSGQIALTATTAGDLLTVSQLVDGSAVTLTTDTMSLGNPVIAGTGNVVLEPFTLSSDVALGTKPVTSPTTLGLTQSDLGFVNPSGALVIGNLTDTGNIQITGLVAPIPLNVQLLTLGSISETSAALLIVNSLRAVGGSGVMLTPPLGGINIVTNLTGGTATAGAAFSFTDITPLTVAAAGIVTDLGAIALNVPAGDSLTVNGAVDTTNGGGNAAGANISLTADLMTITAAINGGTSGIVTLAAAGEAVDLGFDTGNGRLVITQADINFVSGSVLRVETFTGNLFVSGSVVDPAAVGTFSLIAGNKYGIIENGGSIQSGKLALQAVAGIGDGNAILVTGPAVNVPINVAFSNAPTGNANSGGNVQITSSGSGGMVIASEDGVTSSVNGPAGGMVILNAASPITFSVNTTSAGTISATTTETANENVIIPTPPEDDITVVTGVKVESTGGDVDLTAGDSIDIQAGSTVKSDSGTVSLQAGVGDTDGDATLTIDGTISAANLTIVTPGNFLVTTLNVSGTLSITAGGSILEPANPPNADPAGPDIKATNLFLQAGTGIGGSNPVTDPELETQVSNLGATTVTGGIDISNTGVLNVGFGGVGVTDTGASGDITLTSAGTVSITTFGDIVKAPGNVTVTANGPTADVVTGGFNGGSAGAIVSTGGTVTVHADRNVIIGSSGKFGDVQGGGSVLLSAGGNISVDEASFVDAHGTGVVTATAGGNISLLQTAALTNLARITTEGGAINLTTGAGGIFTANSGNPAGDVSTTQNGGNGPITISADDMVINDPITAGTGIVTLQQATTTTRNIDVGGGTTAGDLGLSDTELGQVTAGVLRIGRLDNPGNITVTDNAGLTGGITAHAGFNTLDLESGGTITQADAVATITVTNLALQAVGGVGQNFPTAFNSVDTLAGAVSGSGNGFVFGNSQSLAIGSVDGINGIATNDGSVFVFVTSGTLTVTDTPAVNDVTSAGGSILLVGSSFVNTGSGVAGANINSAGGDIVIDADNMTLQPGSTINSGAGRTSLFPLTVGGLVNVGGANGVGTLGLSAAEINTVTAATLQIGRSVAGNVTVSAHIAPTGTNTLDLESGGSITDGGAGDTLQVTNLALRAANGINLDTVVSNLGFNNTGLAVAIRNTGGLTINNVDGLTSSANTGTTTTITATSPVTFAVSTTSDGDLTVTATRSAGKTGDDITVDGGANPATVQSQTGNVTFNAAGNITLQAGSIVQSAAAGTVNLTAGAAVPGADTGTLTLSLAGTVNGMTVNLRDNAGPITTNSLTGVINATNLSMFATTGVGTLANPIETNVSAVVAKTATGGIFINNNAPPTTPATLTVGYAGEPFTGVTDTGASGNISLTNAGSIDINNGAGDIVKGPVNVTVQANGAGADILTGGNNSGVGGSTTGAVQAGTGTLSLTAGQDILVGDVVGGTFGDVSSSGSITLLAGGNITVDQNSFLNVYGSGTLSATATTGNISFLSTAFFTGARTQGGAMTFSAGGAFDLNSGGPSAFSGVRSNFNSATGGNITVTASSITLDDVMAAGAATIALDATTGGVSQAAPSTVTGGKLALTGLGDFILTQPGNNVGTLAAQINSTGSGTLSYVNSGGLTIGTVNTGSGVVSGISNNGAVNITVGTTLTVSQAIAAGSGAITFVQNGAGGLIDLVASVGGSGGVTVNDAGSAANNSLLVEFNNGAALPNGLTYTGGTGTNTITTDDTGTNVAHTYNVSATSVSRDGAVIAYTSVASLIVNGGNLGDTFNVTPSLNTAYTINGSLPTSNPNGDALNFNGQNIAGLVATINVGATGNGSIGLTGGYQTINFTSIENFSISNVAIQVQDFADAEELNVYASNQNSGFYQFGAIGGGQPQIFFNNVSSFDYLGDADSDVLNIYNPPNSFITAVGGVKLFAPMNGISFEAGGGGSLNIIGGQENVAKYTYFAPTITGHDGTIELDGAFGLEANYTYSGLSPLTNSGGVGQIFFNLPSNTDNAAVLSSGGSFMTVFGSGSNNFETTTVGDPSTFLTVNEGSGTQTLTLDPLDTNFGANINVNGGTGPTIFNVQATPTGTTTTFLGAANAGTTNQINIGSTAPTTPGGTLTTIQGALTLSNVGGGTDAVVADDSGDLSQETNAQLLDIGTSGQLTGLGNGAPISYDLASTSSLLVNGTNNADTFLINQTAVVSPALNATTTINTGTGGDLVNIRATSSGTAYDIQGHGGADTVNIGSQAGVVLPVNSNLFGIQGSVTVENNGGLSTLTIDDSADGGTESAVLGTASVGAKTFDTLTGLGMGASAVVQWAVKAPGSDNETKLVTINGGGGDNLITVNQLLPVGVNGGAITVDLNTGTGTDHTFIEATNGALNVQGQDSHDVVDIGSHAATGNTNGTLKNIIGPITINNTLGFTDINIDDSGDALARTMATINTFTNFITTFEQLALLGNTGSIAWNINEVTNSVQHEDTGLVTINGGFGGNVFFVDEEDAPAPGGNLAVLLNSGGTDKVNVKATNAPLTIQGLNGKDTVNIGSNALTTNTGGNLLGILGPITIANSSGFFSDVHIDDSGDNVQHLSAKFDTTIVAGTPNQNYDRLTGLGNPAPITWDVSDGAGNNDIGAVTVSGGTGTNTYLVDQTAPVGTTVSGSPNVTLFSNGADNVNIEATNAAFTVQGQSGADTVKIGSNAETTNTGGNLLGIQGTVTVANSTGLPTVSTIQIDDSGDNTKRLAATLNTTITGSPAQTYDQLTGLGNAAPILWDINDVSGHNDTGAVTINGGIAGNKYLVNETAAPGNGAGPLNVTLFSNGVDTVNIEATNAPFTLQGENGADLVRIGSNAATTNTGGNLLGIQGLVTIADSAGLSTVNIDDSGDNTPRPLATLDTTITGSPAQTYDRLTGLGNTAAILWDIKDVGGNNDIGAVTISGGTGTDTYLVNQTAAVGSTIPGAPNVTLDSNGADKVNIEATNAAFTVQGLNGADTVKIGSNAATTNTNGTLAGIQGMVIIANSSGLAKLSTVTIDDSGDSTKRLTAKLDTTVIGTQTYDQLTGLGNAPILWDINDAGGNNDIGPVAINGGTGGNTYLVNQTGAVGTTVPGAPSVTLNSNGADNVNIEAVNAAFTVQGQNGADVVNIGSNAATTNTGGNLAGIQGLVTIANSTGAPTVSTVNIDDSGDTTAAGQTATLDTLLGGGQTFDHLTGLGLGNNGAIRWTISDATGHNDTGAVTISGGNLVNTFTVNQTNAPGTNAGLLSVTVNTGTAADAVNIQATNATLNVNGQGNTDTVTIGKANSVQGVLGTVNIQNSGGTDVILVKDSADTVARNVFLTTGQISGLAPAAINYTFSETTSLTVMGGTPTLANTFNTFNVDATAPNATTTVDAGNEGAGHEGDTFIVLGSGLGAGSTDIFNGGNANDTFNVSPSTNATIQVNGNLPTTAPGDVLNITGGTGVSINPTAGQGNGNVTFTGGGQTITYTSIEGFGISNSSITVTDTTEAEILNVYASNHNSGYYQFAGAGQPKVFFTGATSFTYAGDNDPSGLGDTLNVYNSPNGFIVPTNADTLFAPAGGITFTGAANGSLNIIGGSESSATYAYSPDNPVGTHTGTIDLVSGSLDAHYVYSGPNSFLSVGIPVILGTAVTNTGTVNDVLLQIPQNDGDNQATLEANAVAGYTTLVSGNTTFAATSFSDPAHSLTLDAGNDGETVTLAKLDSTFAAPITLNGGTGNDTFNIQATPALATTNVLGGGGNDIVNVGSAAHTVAQIAGTLTIDNPGGTAAVTVDDSADAATRSGILLSTVSLSSVAFGQVSGLGAANIDYNLDDTSTFTLDVGTGADKVTVNQTLPATVTGNSAVVVGGPNTNTINVQNTSGGITYDIQATAAAPTVNVGLPGPAGTVQGINGTVDIENTGGGLNTIVVNDVADATGQNVTMSTVTGIFAQDGGQISGLAPGGVDINYEYADTGALTVDGGKGGNTFNVQATGPNFTTQLNTGAGNDMVNVGSSSNKLDDIAGILSVNGQGNTASPLNPPQTVVCMTPPGITIANPMGDQIFINDSGSSVAAAYTLNAGSLVRTGGASAAAAIDFTNIETVNVTTGTTAGPNTNVDITGTAPNSTTAVNTTVGTAVVAVVNTGASSVLDINGSAPVNQVTLQNTGSNSIVAVHGNAGTNTMTVLNTGANAGVLLDSGTGIDTMNVEGAAAGSLIQVIGSGTNTVNIGSNPANPAASTLNLILASEICVVATTLNINDHGSSAAHTYTVSDVSVQRDAGTLIENMGVGSMVLNCGTGGNIVNVVNTASGTNTTVNAGGGPDAINIMGTGDTLNVNGQGGLDTVSVTNAHSVQGINGTVNIEDPNGAMTLTVDDSADTNPETVTMSTLPADPSDSEHNLDPYGQISGMAPAAINYEYADTKALTVFTGQGGLFGTMTVDVMATGLLAGSATTPTMLISNGPTAINVGGDANVGAQNILGPLFLQNSAGPDNVITVDDSNDTVGQNVVLDTQGGDGLITGMSPGVISYALSGTSTSSQLTLLGGSGGNTFTVTNVQVPVLITGGSGNDTLIGPNQNDIWTIPDANVDIDSGTMTPATFPFAVDFTSIANLTGGSMEDVFQFNEGALITGVIDGGGGRNWLDYSGIVTTFVDVNLTAGTADGTGGVTNIQNVIGTAFGGDTLVGGPTGGVLSTHGSGNTLTAGSGPTILIGGYGRNHITGGPKSDLLINGRTTYDPDTTGNPLSVYARLDTIFKEWDSALPYLTRVHTLKSTVFTDPLIFGTTVIAFPGINNDIGPRFGRGGGQFDSTLIGNAGLDWFITGHALDVIDPQPGEIITDIQSPDPAPLFTTYSAHGGSLVVNLAGSDAGAAPTALSGTAATYDTKHWTKTEPILKGVTFSYDSASNNLTVTWPASLTGTFRVFLWDSHGVLFKTFLVNSLKNHPPTISKVSNQTTSHTKPTLTIKNVKAGDPDGDPVTLNAMVTGYTSGKHWISTTTTPSGFDVVYDPVHHHLLITKPAGFKGTFQVTLTASDGTLSTEETFKVKVT